MTTHPHRPFAERRASLIPALVLSPRPCPPPKTPADWTAPSAVGRAVFPHLSRARARRRSANRHKSSTSRTIGSCARSSHERTADLRRRGDRPHKTEADAIVRCLLGLYRPTGELGDVRGDLRFPDGDARERGPLAPACHDVSRAPRGTGRKQEAAPAAPRSADTPVETSPARTCLRPLRPRARSEVPITTWRDRSRHTAQFVRLRAVPRAFLGHVQPLEEPVSYTWRKSLAKSIIPQAIGADEDGGTPSP